MGSLHYGGFLTCGAARETGTRLSQIANALLWASVPRMKWTINDIETFLAVLDAGSISAAAARSDLSKSVVSKRVSEFEAALGISLFVRHAGRITATENAHLLAARLQPALAELVAATEDAGSAERELQGQLVIAAPMSFGIRHLGPMIAEFANAHSELEVILDYDDRLHDLARAGFDVGLRIGQLKDSSLMARRLCEDPRVLVASPDYLAISTPSCPEDLVRHQIIGYRNVRLGDIWPFGPQVPLPAPARVTANNGEAMRDMAIGGLGLALLPLFIAHDALRDGRLVRVLPDLEQQKLPISAVWPPVKPMPRKTRLFVDHLVAGFAGSPKWQQGL